MRTVVTYLDKNNNRVNKEDAWSVMTQVYNDAGNLERTGYSFGAAQIRANEKNAGGLSLADAETGKVYSFTQNYVKAGREAPCELIISIPEKKKIDKLHAVFERREGTWFIIDRSKTGTRLNGEKLVPDKQTELKPGDEIDFAGKKKYTVV